MSVPYHHPACLDEHELLKQCDVTTGPNAGGPGGQNRNKLATLVEITHRPTGLSSHAGEWRTQGENKRAAITRLRLTLATHHRTVPPPAPKLAAPTFDQFLRNLDASIGSAGKPAVNVSALWRSRVSSSRGAGEGRISVNPRHQDYPALLAEALDIIAQARWEPQPAAQRLGVTTSQLIKLVKDHPEALVAWNTQRYKLGLHGMK